MTALHAPPARATGTNVNVKAADHRRHNWEFLLILTRDTGAPQAAAARRTRRGQRGRVGLVNHRGHRTMRMRPVAAARPPARLTRCRRGRPLRKRRGLPFGSPPREVEFPLQPLDFATQALILALRPLALLPFAIPFAFGAFRALTPIRVALIVAPFRHPAFMPNARDEYKYKIVESPRYAWRAVEPAN